MTEYEPPWHLETDFPELSGELEADIAVVGAGIAGVASAHYLARAGFSVALLEQEKVPAGASRYSSGILYFGSGTDFQTALQLWGREKAKLVWDESKRSIDELIRTVREQRIECGLRSPGAVIVARTEEEVGYLRREEAAMRELGYPGELLSKEQVRAHFAGREFLAGLRQPFCHQVHAGELVAELAKRLPGKVFENSPMVSLEENAGGVTVTTPRGAVHAKKVVVATNLEPSFGLDKFFGSESTAVLMCQALPPEQLRRYFPRESILWTPDEKYDILYPWQGAACLEVYSLKGAKEKLPHYYPGLDFQVARQWGDSWAKTKDWLPLLGPVKPNVLVAKAMGDQGIVMGWTSGRKMPALVRGERDAFLELATPGRFPLGS
jgi:glycine/D-amino acid oxidase-like deaminating enzyme